MLTHDIVFALRTLRKTPGLTAVVALSIALGIAANTTVFSMVNATLLGALPVRDPGRPLHHFPEERPFRIRTIAISATSAREYSRACRGDFPAGAGQHRGQRGAPERMWGQLVSGNYFSVVGPPLAVGRGITPEDDQVAGRSAVVVMGDSLWRRVSARIAIVGKTTLFNGRRYAIIGVMSRKFHGSIAASLGSSGRLGDAVRFGSRHRQGPREPNTHHIVITGRPQTGRQQDAGGLGDQRGRRPYP